MSVFVLTEPKIKNKSNDCVNISKRDKNQRSQFQSQCMLGPDTLGGCVWGLGSRTNAGGHFYCSYGFFRGLCAIFRQPFCGGGLFWGVFSLREF